MSRKKPVKYKGYVRYSVDTAVKAAVNKNKLTDVQVLERLFSYAQEGWKLSFDFDIDSETWAISIYGNSHDSPEPGMGLTARHSDRAKAGKLLIVIHEEVYAKVWPQEPGEAPDQYSW